MNKQKCWLVPGVLVLALGFCLAGCVQGSSKPFRDDYTWLEQHEKMGLVSEPSGENTNMGIWVTMQGGG
jgi:hypothetical protein